MVFYDVEGRSRMDIVKRFAMRSVAILNKIVFATGLFCFSISIGTANAEEVPKSFVRLGDIAPQVQQDIRYGTLFNFTGATVPAMLGLNAY